MWMQNLAPARRDKSGEAFLSIEGLNKSFGALPVVHELNLDVRQGEFVTLLGPSGCGKTTTLRMIAGFIDADSGSIIIDHNRVEQIPTHRRDTAMVFQNYALFPHMTIAENVAFGLRMRKTEKSEIARRVGEVLELVRLSGFDGRFPRELSGGQQQRVALARAIVLSPKVLLLDEPLSNLDAKLRKELRTEFLEIHRLAGITTLLVTHDLEEAFSVSDKVAVMNRGRVEQFGTPREIFTQPRTPFVAQFVGLTNVIEGRIESVGLEGASVAVGGIRIATHVEGSPGTAVRLAIPAHLVQVAHTPLPLSNCLAGRVRSVTYLGPMVQFHIEAENLLLRADVPASEDLLRIKVDEIVQIGFKRSDLILLPTGE